MMENNVFISFFIKLGAINQGAGLYPLFIFSLFDLISSLTDFVFAVTVPLNVVLCVSVPRCTRFTIKHAVFIPVIKCAARVNLPRFAEVNKWRTFLLQRLKSVEVRSKKQMTKQLYYSGL